ncbi:cell wall-active antibiotics response protein LiaF [Suicoccus acidiformans]|nr:cell wall-active antibiotics response protein LiaF [Suicoccus acidiformans]
MKEYLKQNLLIIACMVILLLVIDIFTDWHSLAAFIIGTLFLLASIFVERKGLSRLSLFIATFAFVLAIFLTQSIWLLAVVFILFLIVFRAPTGNEFFDTGEAKLVSPASKNTYIGVKLVQPQSKQRKPLVTEQVNLSQANEQQAWDDINLVMLGGNAIVDLGNTNLPEGESIIMLRKLVGRTRIIVPSDVGLHINFSTMSGAVIFEQQRYDLTGENFRWESPSYQASPRRMKLVLSVVFGDVEVIVL